jgi:CubicO group peptidase (beta-lactamase class C family)
MDALMELRAIANDAIARRIFPGAALFLSRGETCFAYEAFGATAYDAEYSRAVGTQTIYDLASLTKLFTATAFIIAAREAKVSASTLLFHFLPQFQSSDKREISLRHLLQHASGIEIAIQDLTEYSPGEWVERIAAAPLHAAPDEKVLYSCTNYFLLARVIEKLCGDSLDDFITARVLRPLSAQRLTFYPLGEFPLNEIAPTEINDATGAPFHGVVHDEAARAWQEYSGRVSCGNAGLFGTAEEVTAFARLWCDNGVSHGQQVLEKSEIEAALAHPLTEGESGTRRAWSWQMDARYFMSERAPEDSIGHAGFTGPTLWLNRSTRDVCVILNNRVFPTREGRERFPTHRRIARWLLSQ